MPIIYVHGVANRDDAPLEANFGDVPWPQVEEHSRKHVAPILSPDVAGVPILRAYWGDLAGRFAWDGLFRVSSEGPKAALPERLATLTPQALGRLIEKTLLGATPDTALWPELVEVAWAVATDAATAGKLASCETFEAEQAFLLGAVETTYRDRFQRAGASSKPEWWRVPAYPFRPGLYRAARGSEKRRRAC